MTFVVGFDIAAIRTDGGTHGRAQLDESTVQAYLAEMLAGAKFPPIILFYDGEVYWLADGFHREAAARRAGFGRIDADVRRGTRRDALLFGIAANGRQGFPRNRKDKRRAVETLLRDREWRRWSNREIARRCVVHNTMVDALRQKVSRSQARRNEQGGVPVNGSEPRPADIEPVEMPVNGSDLVPPGTDEMAPVPVSGKKTGAPPAAEATSVPVNGSEALPATAPFLYGRGAMAIPRAHLHKVLSLMEVGAAQQPSIVDMRELVKVAIGALDELERGVDVAVEKAAPAKTAGRRRKAVAPSGRLSVQSALASHLAAKGARSAIERLLQATERPGSHWPYLEIRALVEFIHKEASECTD